MRRLLELPGLLILLLCPPPRAATIHCGTLDWIGRHAGKPPAAVAKRAAPGPQARTLETANFTLHYALRGIHRIKTTAADAGLVKKTDSLYLSLPAALTGDKADSAVYRKLDSMNAPHPVFADTMAGYFESARAYYVDHLGMHAPKSSVPSHYFAQPVVGAGKYAVDIVDIGSAETDFSGEEIYALTFPANEGGMLMENDFLFRTRLPSSGIPEGDSISSRYRGEVLHNYALDWEAGLKVTCFHEFYHAVQFTYVPILTNRHVWYETGAVGMEERNADEVNDYLQYLPELFSDLTRRSMFDYPYRLSEYGNGIFHLFLAKELDEKFDVSVWTFLSQNGNRLADALAKTFALFNKTSRDVFSDYSAQLAFAGTDFKPPFPLFSQDIPRWPRLELTDLDLRTQDNYSTGLIYAFSLKALRITGARGTGKGLAFQDTVLAPVVVDLGKDSSVVDFPPLGGAVLDLADAPGRENVVLVPNGSLDRVGHANVMLLQSRSDDRVYAYPNPAETKGSAVLYFSRPGRGAQLRIFGEDGISVRNLSFTADQKLWFWDLLDSGGRPVKPGVYYYRADGGPLQALYLGGP